MEASLKKKIRSYLDEFDSGGVVPEDFDHLIELTRNLNSILKNLKFSYLINECETAFVSEMDIEDWYQLHKIGIKIREYV